MRGARAALPLAVIGLLVAVANANTPSVAGSGQDVFGFAFEGTVSGIDGTSTWASDMVMEITSPAGATFGVGGFGTGLSEWDFDGAGSTSDDTYESAHPDVFSPGTALNGIWTVEFEHTFVNGVAMTWDPSTIKLLGEAGPANVILATIELPAFTLAGGESTSFSFQVGDVPEAAFSAMAFGVDGPVITWETTKIGQTQQVERSDTLINPTWVAVGDPVSAEGTNTVIDTSGPLPPTGMYRIRLVE